MKIKNSNFFVSGTNRGIGAALVQALLDRGAPRIYAAARDPSSVARRHRGDGRVVPVALDVTSQSSVEAATRIANDVHVLVNNAGSLTSYSVLEASDEQLSHDFDVNFFGTLRMAKAFAPVLEKSRGAMMNVLTLVSLSSMASIGGYAASKAASWSMTQALRVELGRRGIDVFAAYPGAVDTDMIRAFDIPKTKPEEVANNILEALESDQLDCFPDPMSRQAGDVWLENPRALEKMFANM